jgi:hypothetical protein
MHPALHIGIKIQLNPAQNNHKNLPSSSDFIYAIKFNIFQNTIMIKQTILSQSDVFVGVTIMS